MRTFIRSNKTRSTLSSKLKEENNSASYSANERDELTIIMSRINVSIELTLTISIPRSRQLPLPSKAQQTHFKDRQ